MADPHSHSEEKSCNSLYGRPTSDGNVSSGCLTVDRE